MQDKIEKNDSADTADSVKQFNIMNEKLLPQRTNINKEHAAEEKKFIKHLKNMKQPLKRFWLSIRKTSERRPVKF